MRRVLPVLLVLAACNPPETDVAHTGPPTTDTPPEVLAQSLVRHDFTPSPTTTEPAIVVPATVAAPVVVEPEPVVPLTTEPPVVATTGPATNSGRLGDPYYIPTWHTLRECEAPDWAGGWQANTGNGFYGGLQFTLSSWEWVGGSGYPHEASVDEQIRRGQMLWEHQGWRAWPACSRKLGWR